VEFTNGRQRKAIPDLCRDSRKLDATQINEFVDMMMI